MVKETFKEGDWLYHKKNYTTYWTEGKVFQFEKYSREKQFIYELNGNGANIWAENCRKALSHEIPAEHRKNILEKLELW